MSSVEQIQTAYGEKIQSLLEQDIPYRGARLENKTIVAISAAHHSKRSQLVDKVISLARYYDSTLNMKAEPVFDYRKVMPVQFDTITERPVDPDSGIEGDWVIDQLENGLFVTCSVSDSGILRATTAEDYPAKYSVLEAGVSDVERLAHRKDQLGYQAFKCMWLTLPLEQWIKNLDAAQSAPDYDEIEFYDQLEESVEIIDYGLRNYLYYLKHRVSYSDNDPDMSGAALRVIKIDHGDNVPANSTDSSNDYSQEMFNYAIHRLSTRYHDLHKSKPITSVDSL